MIFNFLLIQVLKQNICCISFFLLKMLQSETHISVAIVVRQHYKLDGIALLIADKNITGIRRIKLNQLNSFKTYPRLVMFSFGLSTITLKLQWIAFSSLLSWLYRTTGTALFWDVMMFNML